MSDGEFRAASLAIREWALWVAIAQVAIGAIQTGIVYYGIGAMVRATDQRGRDAERDRKERAEAAAEARRDAERDRKERAESAERARKERAEAAAAARREADQRHAESMAAINAMAATLAANTATLAEATAALKVVVERATPGAIRQPE